MHNAVAIGGAKKARIEIIPLIDIIFFLLATFVMVSLSMTQNQGVQVALLAALVTEDPLLLIGRAGTGKTYLLNSISEALGLEHRHYNASLIAFDDLVGFPYPDDARERIRSPQDRASAASPSLAAMASN